MKTRVVRTVCPRAGYGGEVLLAHVENGKLVRVEGDPDDRFSRGKLTPFAERYVQRVHHPDRLLQPLARSGDRGTGSFEPISWDEALGRIASTLDRIARTQDPRALLYYAGKGQDGVMTQCGGLFLSYFGGYSTVYGDLCNAAGREATRLTFGSLACHSPEDYVNSRMVVIWGQNPAITNPHQVPFLLEAKAAGAQLVCVDPNRTETAALCDVHLSPRPGTDGFLANSIAHVLIEEGLFDKDFVDAHVHGFEDYRWLIRNCEPKKAEDICDLPAETIVDFARRLAAARPAHVNVGFGLQRYRNGGQTVRAVAALQAILGNIGVPGGGFDFFNQGAFVTRPYPFQVPTPPRVRQLGPVSRLGRVVLGAADPPVSAAIIERANPMTQTPQTAAVHYALARLDFVCVIDQFLTDTAMRADIVLPAKSMFEETDVRAGAWDGMLHLKQACIESPGEVKTEREIYRALAVRLGYPTDQFDIPSEEILNRVLPAGLSVNRLKKKSFTRRGPTVVPFARRQFQTPSGRIELKSEVAEISWKVDPLPFYAPPRESAQADPERFKRFPLQLLTPKSADRHLSQGALDEGVPGETIARLHPDEAKARGIADGDRVRVFNDRGEARCPARTDDAIRLGVLVIPQGRWISRDGFSVNVFTHDDQTDMGYGAIFLDCLVQVEKDGA
jgi:anaerobic selenocysteine-containing dehydrogenase